MNNNIIDKLFYGDFNPYSEIYNSKEAKKHFNKINDILNDLDEIIFDEELKMKIQDLMETYSATTEFLVKCGYRTGMRDAEKLPDEIIFCNYDE